MNPLLRTISGLVRTARGEVLLEGNPIHTLGAERIARLGVGHAPEGRRLFSRMTVRENLEMGAFNRRDPDFGCVAGLKRLGHRAEVFPKPAGLARCQTESIQDFFMFESKDLGASGRRPEWSTCPCGMKSVLIVTRSN